MKIRKKIVVVFLLSVLVLSHKTPILAAGQAGIGIPYLFAEESSTKVKAVCTAAGVEPVTNGKIRILYNPEELKLEKAQVKEGLSKVTVEINDSINGNKPQGELVLVFASPSSVSVNGDILKMTFQSLDGLNHAQGAGMQVIVEELANDGSEITAEGMAGNVPLKNLEKTENTVTDVSKKSKANAVKTADDNAIIPAVLGMLVGITAVAAWAAERKRKCK